MRPLSHGHACTGKRTPEYIAWGGMLQRCLNPYAFSYQDYGGRGITVCESWKSFANFLADMGLRPGEDYTLERIDNTLGYSPKNCKWATRSEQQQNKRLYKIRENSKLGISGVTCRKRGKLLYTARINVKGVEKHLYEGENFFEACCVRKSWENRLNLGGL